MQFVFFHVYPLRDTLSLQFTGCEADRARREYQATGPGLLILTIGFGKYIRIDAKKWVQLGVLRALILEKSRLFLCM
jgi:hypothetical protein